MSAQLPPITERDLSFHEAQAGIAAREAAAAAGGDVTQLRALVGAAQAADTGTATGAPKLKGHALRGDDLLVSLCFMLYAKVFGEDPRTQVAAGMDEPTIPSLKAIAALALIFTQTDTAYDLLDRAADVELSKDDAAGWARDFTRSAADFAGDFGPAEIGLIGRHIVTLARRVSAGEDEPGKSAAS